MRNKKDVLYISIFCAMSLRLVGAHAQMQPTREYIRLGSQVVAIEQPSPASCVASSITTGNPINVTATIASQPVSVAFCGTAGEEINLQVTGSTVPGCLALVLSILKPDGTQLASGYVCGATGGIPFVTLPVAGAYTAVIAPQSGGTGIATVTLSVDQTGSITPGTSDTVTINIPGQNAQFPFSGTAGEEVNLQVTGSTVPGCLALVLSIFKPDGTQLTSGYVCGATGGIPFVTLPAAGTYTAVIAPQSGGTGSATVTLSVDQTGSITPGASDTVTINIPGQNAQFPFSGTAGEEVNLQVTGSTFPGCLALALSILKPDGTQLASGYVCGATGGIPFVTLPAAGTYTAVIAPQNGGTGSDTVTLSVDQTGSITPGTGDTVTINIPGQNARFAFSGTAGGEVNLQVTGSTFPGCLALALSILKPDGTQLASGYVCGATGGIPSVTLPLAGTYTAVIAPQNGGTGSAIVTLSEELAPPPGLIDMAPHDLTSDSSHPPYLVSASSFWPSLPAYGAFDNAAGNEYWIGTNAGVDWLQIDLGSSQLLGSYAIQATTELLRMPKNWTMEGSNDGTTWIVVDTQTAQTAWTNNEVLTFTVSAVSESYRYYRLDITANNGDATYTDVGEMYLYQGATGTTAQTITFPAIAAQLNSNPPFALSATASSGLTVSYAVTSGPATVSGATVALTGAPGTVTIQATQTGNGVYAAATPVSQSFAVTYAYGADMAPHNLTSDTSHPPYVVSASSFWPSLPAYAAFDNAAGNEYWVGTNAGVDWLQIDLGSSQLLGSYAIQATTELLRMPKNWTMEGSNDGTTWNVVDTQTGQTAWTNNEILTFTVSAVSESYRYYRLDITANNGDATYTDVGEMYLYQGIAP
jgi:hypothetical protein